MMKGKDFNLQSSLSSEAGWRGQKLRDEKRKHGSDSLHTAAVQTQPFQ